VTRKAAASGVIATLIAIALVVSFYFVRAPLASPLTVGAPAPDFDLTAIGFAGRVRLSELRGKPIVLGIVDTRWPDFLDVVEGLERQNRALRRRGLTVVGVFIDDDAKAPTDFVAAYSEVTFTPAHDPGGRTLAAGYGRPLAPELVVIDARGNVVARSTDVAAWRTAAFRKTLEALVDPERPGS
jgi:peroxiredoxin